MARRSKFNQATQEAVVSLSKRRGFVFAGSEIYGGIGSIWDYGPAGAELKRNIRNTWWRSFVTQRPDVVGLDSAIMMHPRTWEASGHARGFTDPLAECPACRKRWRADLAQDGRCPDCGEALGEARPFNLMLQTHLGPVQDESSATFLRPETAQGIFVNFLNVLNSARLKPPFGVAQIGKSFRNEITPGNFIFRTREFEQMEMEFFVHPQQVDKWYDHWVEFCTEWFKRFGIRSANLRFTQHPPDKVPHYARASGDLEFKFPWGWGELETIANRTDHDLKAHAEHSGKDLQYFDSAANERYTPYVVEPSMGVDRTVLAFMLDAYDEEQLEKDVRTVLRFHPDIAPFQVAVLPLSRNEALVPAARRVLDSVAPIYNCQYDDAQSIGRRYRRQDEIGTPLCVTVDFDTVEKDQAVTIRDRDTMQQVRVPAEGLAQAVADRLAEFRREYEEEQS